MVMAFAARPSGARTVTSRQDFNSRTVYSAMEKTVAEDESTLPLSVNRD